MLAEKFLTEGIAERYDCRCDLKDGEWYRSATPNRALPLTAEWTMKTAEGACRDLDKE
jgi:hypothetical protein